jgi:hypothetical protein
VYGFLIGNWNQLAVFPHQRRLGSVLILVTKEFGLAHGAAILHFHYFAVFYRQFDIVAQAAADWTSYSVYC